MTAAVKYKIILPLAVLCLVLFLWAPEKITASELEQSSRPAQNFKVVGYYSGDLFDEPVERLRTDLLTHVVYAFLIPDADGSLIPLEKSDKLKELVAQAHQDEAKVFIALGGYSYQGIPLVTTFEKLAAEEESRNFLVENVCRFIRDYDLDGMELNWEHPNAETIGDYEQLAMAFRQALDKEGKEFGAVMNGAWSPEQGPEVNQLMTESTLECFDYIEAMAYDQSEDDHSPLWFAETSVAYWLNRGISKDNLILGIPLYARPSWLQYRHLVAENRSYAYVDYVGTEPLVSYYNGINTIREKTMIALRKAGGVMLFDINEDSDDDTSVLAMIDELLTRIRDLSPEELQRYITVIINGQELVFSKESGLGVPFINSENRTLIPLRATMEAINAEITYDDIQKTVAVEQKGNTITISVNKTSIIVNGEERDMDSAAIIMENRVYVPLRAVLEALGYEITWHESSSTIYV
ncbi:MAG: hypothetical protein LBR98_01115 [Syntrophomonadaceae bacterium]|jgi:hypothetical protein|nr:hypothetical protein [Syntrophomonadaceae bacterium]